MNEEQAKILRCAQNDRETMRRQSRDKFRGGFTFVEILVVVLIISILTTGILVVASSVLKKAKVNATQGVIQNLASALQEYKIYHEANFNGFDTDKDTWIESLYAVPNCKKILNNIPDDLKANEIMINGEYNNTVDTIYDSWDEPIEIESNGVGNFPTIRSLGPDKTRNTADDIVSDTITM